MLRKMFFTGFLGVWSKGGTAKPQSAAEVKVTVYSQPHVLKEKMERVEMTHGQTVTATLSPVRLEKSLGEMALFFCPMKQVEISEVISEGDGGEIPAHVTIQGLTLLPEHRDGLYKLKNVCLSSNGSIQVTATEKTVWEPYDGDMSVSDDASARQLQPIGTS